MNSSITRCYRQASVLPKRHFSRTHQPCRRRQGSVGNSNNKASWNASKRQALSKQNLKKKDRTLYSKSKPNSQTTTTTITSFTSNPISWYSQKLSSHPILTKCITSGIIAGAGDLACQYIVHCKQGRDKTEPVVDKHVFRPDLIRSSRFTILGFALIAPVVHFWYGTLMIRIPGTSAKAVLQRLVLDQAFFAPLFIPTFLTNLMMLEGRPMEDVPKTLVRDVPDIVVTNWTLWIPAMFVNFKYIPGKWQVLYSNGVGFIWNMYLSWKTQKGQD